MSIAIAPPDEAVSAAAGTERAEFLTALIDLRNFYATHDTAPMPGGLTVNIRVPGSGYKQREAALYRIAAALGVNVIERDRVLYAERQFGPILLEAHLAPQQEGTIAWLNRTAKRPAGQEVKAA